MINFPAWVTNPKRQSKQQLAEKRLRYLMSNAALQKIGRGSVTAFANAIGLESTTVNLYAKKGKLSRPAAERAEKVFGHELIKADWLLNPLSIKGD